MDKEVKKYFIFLRRKILKQNSIKNKDILFETFLMALSVPLFSELMHILVDSVKNNQYKFSLVRFIAASIAISIFTIVRTIYFKRNIENKVYVQKSSSEGKN